MTAPFSSSNIRSDNAIRNSRFCSTTTMASPRSCCSRESIAAISSTIDGWIPSVGSSSNSRSGSLINPRAMARICCSPPLSAPACLSSSTCKRGKSCRIPSIAVSASRPLAPVHANSRFSRAVKPANIPRPCGTYETPRLLRSCAARRVISRPS